MPEFGTTASLKDIFRFPFRGPQWQTRLLIGAALMVANFLIPFVPAIFVSGYTLRVMRQAIRGDKLELPPWDDWGEMAKDGLDVLLISLVYLAPGIVVLVGGTLVVCVAWFGLPFFMALLAESGRAGIWLTFLFPLLLMGAMLLMFVSIVVGYLLCILGGAPLPMAKAHLAAQGELAAAFRVKEWGSLLRGNRLSFFIAWVVMVGLFAIWYTGAILAYYTLILTLLVPFLATLCGFYSSLVGAALFGQVYRESVELQAGAGAPPA